jgi:dipeptidyl aminopeptidase/acylaminoacyl peptidase
MVTWMFALRWMVALLGVLAWPGAAHADCSMVLPAGRSLEQRAVTARDIIQLREIGFPDGALSGPSPLAVSPDGRRIAFVINQADVQTNAYCRGLVVLELVAGAKPQLIDVGGEFMPMGTFVRGLWVEVGLQKPATPAWAPDGRSVAVLRRDKGVTQAVVIGLDGRPRLSTHVDADIEDLRWNPAGTRLFFTSRPGFKVASKRIEEEGKRGWFYDQRMAPNDGAAPRIEAGDAPSQTFALDVATGSVQPAESGGHVPIWGAERARSGRGEEAFLEPEGASPVSPDQLRVKLASGEALHCPSAACRGRFAGLWWAPHNREIWFLKREGWNHGTSAFYRWRIGTAAPVRSLATDDVIDNCVAAGSGLACTAENSSHPRTVQLIEPKSGSRRVLFDPNPEIADVALGRVVRLKWRNDFGLEAWGDLAVPPGAHKGAKLPLIIVQYNSRGFLRGGTGNEYPIYPLVAAGYAVLSFDRPAPVASTHTELKTDVELNAANEKGWAERKSVLSALQRGIDLAIATGMVDPKRIGITGLSDGATSARFALLNSNRFAAAAISSCCLEPKTIMTYGGIRWAQFNRAVGYPLATVDDPQFWRPVSLVVNAQRFHTPLLIQQSDDEYLLSLEALEALREKEAPVELYVFPDEHHVKWQPGHKMAVFLRTLDWFNYWLKCRKDPDPTKLEQYRRWDAMRQSAKAAGEICHWNKAPQT